MQNVIQTPREKKLPQCVLNWESWHQKLNYFLTALSEPFCFVFSYVRKSHWNLRFAGQYGKELKGSHVTRRRKRSLFCHQLNVAEYHGNEKFGFLWYRPQIIIIIIVKLLKLYARTTIVLLIALLQMFVWVVIINANCLKYMVCPLIFYPVEIRRFTSSNRF